MKKALILIVLLMFLGLTFYLTQESPKKEIEANSQENTSPCYGNFVLFGIINHCQDINLVLLPYPPAFYLSHEPPFVFFLGLPTPRPAHQEPVLSLFHGCRLNLLIKPPPAGAGGILT